MTSPASWRSALREGKLTPRRVWRALARRRIDTRFLRRYYEEGGVLWHTFWMGVPVRKMPSDLWTLQEILFETRPDLIVETGTDQGGSALFMASVCDLIGHGEIVTVDVSSVPDRPRHPRVTYVEGSSTDPAVVESLKQRASAADKVMVVLDSDHSEQHVLGELRMLAPLVSGDCYLIVEDTIVNGNPVEPDYGPGPAEALVRFSPETHGFVVDRRREKFHVTFNRGGYLRRVTAAPPCSRS
jgi:cephalosporin hydroxylase